MIKNERGFTLLEVLIAVALVSLIAVAFLSGLATASKVLVIADERGTSESLARSQMEHIKNQSYSSTNVDWDYTVSDSARSYTTLEPDWWDDSGSPGNPPLLSSNYAGYSVEAIADEDDANAGIQKITVIINHYTKEVITLEGYKVDR